MKPTLKIFLVFTIIYAIIIFYLSSISDLIIPREWLIWLRHLAESLQHNDYLFLLMPFYPLLKQQDKVLHILVYFGFGVLLFLTLKSAGRPVIKSVILTVLAGILYGASDEFHQMFVPGRSASIMDLLADTTGILFAQVILIVIYLIISIFLYTSRPKTEKRL